MATLSKMVIESISEKMTEKSKKYLLDLEEKYSQVVTDFFESQIPEQIIKVFKTHPEYIETTMSAYLDGYGFNRESVTLTKRIPSTSSFHAKLNLNAAMADKILKVKRKMEKAKEDYNDLLQQTQSALFALKTEKNIRENLPEAIPFLPPPMSNSLVVNFSSLQQKLNKQPEIKSVETN